MLGERVVGGANIPISGYEVWRDKAGRISCKGVRVGLKAGTAVDSANLWLTPYGEGCDGDRTPWPDCIAGDGREPGRWVCVAIA